MKRSTMQAHGYRDDGIVGYIATSQAPGTQPLYRLVKPRWQRPFLHHFCRREIAIPEPGLEG